jgi:hypothetical protein
MPINLNISVENPHELAAAVLNLACQMGAQMPLPAEPDPINSEPDHGVTIVSQAEPVAEHKKPRGKKAPAADVVIEQPKTEPVQTDLERAVAQAPANDAGERLATIEQVREFTREQNKLGHFNEFAEEMAVRGIKRMSSVDSEAAVSGAPSALFGAYITAVEARIAAKVAAAEAAQ